MKRVFLISRYGNSDFTTTCCRVVKVLGHAPFSRNVMYGNILDWDDPKEREAILAFGHCFLQVCHEAWVMKGDPEDNVTTEMRRDIGIAIEYGIKIRNVIVGTMNRDGNAKVEILDVGDIWKRTTKELLVK